MATFPCHFPSMFERHEKKHIQSSMERFPAVCIIGPRQVGKTTLAKELGGGFPDSLYLDLENPSHIARLSDPVFLFRQHASHLCILDEIQRVPEIFPTLRSMIDENRVPGRFLLLGSASPSLLRQTSESLAGRIRYHELHPFNVNETTPDIPKDRLWLKGGFPPATLSATNSDAMEWLEMFVQTFLDRDLPGLDFTLPSLQLRRFMTMLAHCQGQLFNSSRLASSLGVASTTTRRWLDVLTATFMVRQLQPWIPNIGKRIIKTPKTYVRDSGILHRLLGIDTFDQLISHPVCGHSWEGFVVEQISALMPFRTELYHYRSRGGAEIDLILKIPGVDGLTAVEIKRSLAPKVERGFWNAMEDTQCKRAFVIYPGKDRWPMAENVAVLPISQLQTIFEPD